MGTSIELRVGNVSLSYSKNHLGIDYGHLFQEGDLARRKSDSINYDYYDDHPEEKEDLAVAEEGFSRKLSRVLPRLDLLGHTLEVARTEYQALVAEAVEFASQIGEAIPDGGYLSFDEFCSLACRYPLGDLEDGYIDLETQNSDLISRGRFSKETDLLRRLPKTDSYDQYWSESSFLAARVCILSAESMLHVFGLSAANADVDVTWEFGPIVHAGWVERKAFQPGARKGQRIMIATEGASDARIIQRSMKVMREDVSDFFNFVDVDERHHFWGTGNLVKFAEGLLRIDVLNKVLFVFDNDAEGVDAFRKLEKLNLPANMRAMVLPVLDEFRRFSTRGPEGVGVSDINGRAAAIECYLDLRLDQYPPPQVTWSNFKRDIDAWHGILDFKESYSKYFHSQSDEMLKNGAYDTSKILRLLDAIVMQARLVSPIG